MLTVEIPLLLGSTEKARAHVADAYEEDGAGEGVDVCINMRECTSFGPSAMQAMVTDILVTRKARRILLRGCSEKSGHAFVQCARTHGLASLVYLMDAEDWVLQTEDLSVRCVCKTEPCMCGSAMRDDYLRWVRDR